MADNRGTDMKLIIVTFLLYCSVCFFIHFCCDTAKIWKSSKDEPSLDMPKLTDLHPNDTNKSQRYTEKVISPAIRYFEMRAEIKKANEVISASVFGAGLLLFSSFALFSLSLVEASLFTIKWLCPIIALPLCGFAFWVILIVYKKTKLSIPNFDISLDELKKECRLYVNNHKEFDIPKSNAINNCIIMKHYNYLYSIYDTVVFRCSLSKSFVGISVVICLFVWMLFK